MGLRKCTIEIIWANFSAGFVLDIQAGDYTRHARRISHLKGTHILVRRPTTFSSRRSSQCNRMEESHPLSTIRAGCSLQGLFWKWRAFRLGPESVAVQIWSRLAETPSLLPINWQLHAATAQNHYCHFHIWNSALWSSLEQCFIYIFKDE